jgi:hypothetical protein
MILIGIATLTTAPKEARPQALHRFSFTRIYPTTINTAALSSVIRALYHHGIGNNSRGINSPTV